MDHQATPFAHQSLSAGTLPAGWKLDAGRALSLRPRSAGVLRVTQGRVWVTLDSLRGDVQVSGDLFLVPGRGLVVQAGQRLVIESSDTERQAAAHFSWDPLAQPQAQALHHATGHWHLGVAQPVRDLGLALGQAGAALGRLAHGLAMLALGVVTRRVRPST